ncbi:MAG: glycoside hydrolase family 5 protein [Prevotella sp.]
MRKIILVLLSLFLVLGMNAKLASRFVTIDGMNLVQPNGENLFIKGTNLGNWLNPEGYMFGFKKANCYWMIDEMISQMVGPDAADLFWKEFKDNYITRGDIEFIASTGANTIRLPFNYKLFTDEDYMGLKSNQDGFARIDSVVKWCKDNHLFLILDMHDCPGGQTGDNIDNSYGYPWLFESKASQQLFCSIWQKIAAYYKNEPVILGYELMNEPIAPYFNEKVEEFNSKLESLYKLAVSAIRKVDNQHIILLGGSQWNGNFDPFTDWSFDKKIMYTCHRYGGSPEKEAFQKIIDFRDKTKLPMYMGETGHNSDEWQARLCKMMVDNNIGYTFWPYKKIDNSCFNGILRPAEWDSVIVKFAEADRSTFELIRKARPDQAKAMKLLMEYIHNSRCENCIPQESYIHSLGLTFK